MVKIKLENSTISQKSVYSFICKGSFVIMVCNHAKNLWPQCIMHRIWNIFQDCWLKPFSITSLIKKLVHSYFPIFDGGFITLCKFCIFLLWRESLSAVLKVLCSNYAHWGIMLNSFHVFIYNNFSTEIYRITIGYIIKWKLHKLYICSVFKCIKPKIHFIIMNCSIIFYATVFYFAWITLCKSCR